MCFFCRFSCKIPASGGHHRRSANGRTGQEVCQRKVSVLCITKFFFTVTSHVLCCCCCTSYGFLSEDQLDTWYFSELFVYFCAPVFLDRWRRSRQSGERAETAWCWTTSASAKMYVNDVVINSFCLSTLLEQNVFKSEELVCQLKVLYDLLFIFIFCR